MAPRLRIEVRVTARARIVKASPLAGAAVVFVALMVAHQPASHQQPAATPSHGVVTYPPTPVPQPSITRSAAPRVVHPTRNRSTPEAGGRTGGSCRTRTVHGAPVVVVTATNPTAHRTNLHVSVNLYGPDDEFLDNKVAVLRHLGPHAGGQATRAGRGDAVTCEVVAVSDF